MKTTIILAAISLSVVTTSAFAESDSYIKCAFDDFDTNSEVINTTTTQAIEKTAPAAAASENYIAWTFDDFDSNCDVINSTTIQADEAAAMLAVFYEKDVSDEIGW